MLYKYFVATVFLLSVSFIVCSQESIPVIELDELTGTAKSDLPFDQEFYLKIHKDKNLSILSLEISKIGKYGKKELFNKNEIERIDFTYNTHEWLIFKLQKKSERIRNNLDEKSRIYSLIKKNESDKISMTFSSKVITKSEKIILYTRLLDSKEFIQKDDFVLVKIFPLNPRSHYIFSYNSYIKNDEIKEGLSKILLNQQETFAPRECDTTVSNIIKCYINTDNYSEAINLLRQYDMRCGHRKIDSLLNALSREYEIIQSQKINFNSFLDCYDTIIPTLLKYEAGKDNKYILEKHCFNICDNLISINTKDSINHISNGLLTLDGYHQLNETTLSDFEKRVENLQSTALYIDKILTINTVYNKIKECNCNELRVKLNHKIDSFYEFLKHYNQLCTILRDYKIGKISIMAEYKNDLSYANTLGYTTMESKGKFTVRPDFGISLVSNFVTANSSGNNYTTIVPFMGVRLNFRSLDPKIPFSCIRYKSFAHRSSINISFSLTSVSDGKTRFDLYKNTSFLFGYGYRINNALNLSLGAIFFNKSNVTPFVSSKKFTALPYAGIAIDFEILETFKNLIDVFK